jgi:hypothetical protein
LIEQSTAVSSFHVISSRSCDEFLFARGFATIFLFSSDFSVSKALTPQSADERINLRISWINLGIPKNARRNTGIHWGRLALPPKSDGCSLYLPFDGTLFFFPPRARSDVFVSHLHRDWIAAVYISVWGRESLIFVHRWKSREIEWNERYEKACATFRSRQRRKSVIFILLD